MTSAAFLPAHAADMDDATIHGRITHLVDAYETIGHDLDLFTSGETDSPARFEFSDDLEMGLILLFASLQSDLPSERSIRPLDCLDGAERLSHGARWLSEMADRAEREFDSLSLSAKLRLLAESCQDVANLLWWRWLQSFEPGPAKPAGRLGVTARAESAILGT
ncbi:MAG: hypothetical protein JNK37_04535 [Verrucomicrobiales bacterium]|nr:hypothetical protein [Verrucomicrobiales bacterium]